VASILSGIVTTSIGLPSLKAGQKLHQAAVWLAEYGIEIHPVDLLHYRDISELYPPETRSMRATYCCHIECGGPEELARDVAILERDFPGKVGSTVSEDARAFDLYGPC
jgi:hypothetical protein